MPTTLIFGYGSVDHARVFHDVAGWLMLPLSVLMLLGVVRLIRWLELPVTSFRLVPR
jgi:hypothetical protein